MNTLSHNGFTAWISSNGANLCVYNVKIDTTNPKEISCWIASDPDTPFSVAWRKDDPRQVASSGHILLDGQDVASGIMRPKRTRHVERSAAKISAGRAKPFYFTQLELTDDETIAPIEDDRLLHVGTIKLEITYVKLGSAVPLKTVDPVDIGVAHEKAKKAGALCTVYGDAERIENGLAVSTKAFYANNPGPHVTFVFRYHQRAVLQAWGYIPRTLKRSRDDLNSDEEDEDVKPRNVVNVDSEEETESPTTGRKRAKRGHVPDPEQDSEPEEQQPPDTQQMTDDEEVDHDVKDIRIIATPMSDLDNMELLKEDAEELERSDPSSEPLFDVGNEDGDDEDDLSFGGED